MSTRVPAWPRVCFKPPLGGDSFFFLPFLLGCDLGEIDGRAARWMLNSYPDL